MTTHPTDGPVVVAVAPKRTDIVCPHCKDTLAFIWIPGTPATLDLLSQAASPLFEAHRQGCASRLPDAPRQVAEANETCAWPVGGGKS